MNTLQRAELTASILDTEILKISNTNLHFRISGQDWQKNEKKKKKKKKPGNCKSLYVSRKLNN